jgi:hypothetical protein
MGNGHSRQGGSSTHKQSSSGAKKLIDYSDFVVLLATAYIDSANDGRAQNIDPDVAAAFQASLGAFTDLDTDRDGLIDRDATVKRLRQTDKFGKATPATTRATTADVSEPTYGTSATAAGTQDTDDEPLVAELIALTTDENGNISYLDFVAALDAAARADNGSAGATTQTSGGRRGATQTGGTGYGGNQTSGAGHAGTQKGHGGSQTSGAGHAGTHTGYGGSQTGGAVGGGTTTGFGSAGDSGASATIPPSEVRDKQHTVPGSTNGGASATTYRPSSGAGQK